MLRSGAALSFLALVLACCPLSRAQVPGPTEDRIRVAVLDFENRSALDAASVSYLADVVRDEARRALPHRHTIVMTRDS